MDGWRDGRGRSKGFEFARGRGEYRFRSLMQPDKKGRNYAVFCLAGYIKLFIYGCWWHVAHRIAEGFPLTGLITIEEPLFAH